MGVCRIGQRIAPIDKRGDRAALQHLEKRTGAGLQRRRRIVSWKRPGRTTLMDFAAASARALCAGAPDELP